jgi:hypothetical protein
VSKNIPKILGEYHFTARELADATRLSADTIHRWCQRQPDVVIICARKPGKRIYRTYRIPASAALRLYQEFSLWPPVLPDKVDGPSSEKPAESADTSLVNIMKSVYRCPPIANGEK